VVFYVFLVVFYPSDNPAIKAVEPMITVLQGERVDLEIYTSGNPPPNSDTISWSRNGVLVSSSALLDQRHRLRIDNAQLSDAGVYNISVIIVISAVQGSFLERHTLITLRVIGK